MVLCNPHTNPLRNQVIPILWQVSKQRLSSIEKFAQSYVSKWTRELILNLSQFPKSPLCHPSWIRRSEAWSCKVLRTQWRRKIKPPMSASDEYSEGDWEQEVAAWQGLFCVWQGVPKDEERTDFLAREPARVKAQWGYGGGKGGWGNLFILKYVFIYLAVLSLAVACRICSCSMWDLVPWPGIELGPPALGVWSLGHWTIREVPRTHFWGQSTIGCWILFLFSSSVSAKLL